MRNRTVDKARSKVAVAVRDGHPPEQIEQARAELQAANFENAIQRAVERFGPFTAEQRAKLSVLLQDGGGHE